MNEVEPKLPPATTHRAIAAALSAYRLALYLYPRSFRDRHGADLLGCAKDQLVDLSQRSKVSAAWALVRTFGELPRSALVAWFRAFHPSRPVGEASPRSGSSRSLVMSLIPDLRGALRGARRNPALFALAVLSLTAGTAAVAILLAILDATLWLDSPAPRPNDLTRLVQVNEQGQQSFSYANYRSVAEQGAEAFTDVALHVLETFAVATEQGSQLVHGELVTGNYFQTLGIRPALGAFFDEHSDQPTQPLEAVLSHSFWQRFFAADPNIVGRVVRINDLPMTIVGVAQPDFVGTKFLLGMDLWVPIRPWGRALGWGEWEEQRGNRSWLVFARRHPGVSLASAQRTLDGIADRLAADYPETNRGTRFAAYGNAMSDATPHIGGPAKTITALVLAICGLVLLVAVANVMATQLARGFSRTGELGLRHALGARKAELLRQALGESVLIGLASAIAVLPFVLLGGRLASRYVPLLPYRLTLETAPESQRVVVTVLMTFAAALVAGVLPALRAVHGARALALGGLRSTASESKNRGLDVLVVGVVAAAFCTLVVASLLSRSLASVRNAEPGIRDLGQMMLAFETGLARDPAPDPRTFYSQLLQQADSRPEVARAVVTSVLPLGDRSNSLAVFAGDRSYGAEDEGIPAWSAAVSPGYFEVMGTALLQGRGFDPRDGVESDSIVINRTLAERLWPQGSWLGQRVRFGRDTQAPSYEIVGVAEAGSYEWISETSQAAVFVPFERVPSSFAYLVVSREAPELATAEALRAVARGVDSRIPAFDLRTMRGHLRSSAWAFRMGAELATGAAMLALLMAIGGLYGVIAYRVEQRAREFGIRLAVGAGAPRVLWSVLGRGLRLNLVGLAVGAALALLAGSALSNVLVGVGGRDPLTYAVVALALSACVALASLRPAWRAAGVDPVTTLRGD